MAGNNSSSVIRSAKIGWLAKTAHVVRDSLDLVPWSDFTRRGAKPAWQRITESPTALGISGVEPDGKRMLRSDTQGPRSVLNRVDGEGSDPEIIVYLLSFFTLAVRPSPFLNSVSLDFWADCVAILRCHYRCLVELKCF